jgi:hypothetical protein
MKSAQAADSRVERERAALLDSILRDRAFIHDILLGRIYGTRQSIKMLRSRMDECITELRALPPSRQPRQRSRSA